MLYICKLKWNCSSTINNGNFVLYMYMYTYTCIVTILYGTQAPGQHWEYMMTDEEYDEGGHVIEPFHGQTSFDVDEPVQ